MRPKDHPVQPSPEQVIAKVQEAIALKNFEYIYLTTEDVNIIKKFQQAFSDKLILPNREYVKYDNNSGKLITSYSTGQNKFNNGLDYLVSMLLLDECGGLIASLTSGIRSFMCLSKNWNNFKYKYIFDLGRY